MNQKNDKKSIEEQIIIHYKMGFDDSLDGKEKKIFDDSILNTSYKFGYIDAIVGDDIESIDLKSEEDIIKEVLEHEKKNTKLKKIIAVSKHHIFHLQEYILGNPLTSTSILAGTALGTFLFIKFVIKKKK